MAAPVFILATDLDPAHPDFSRVETQAVGLQAFATRTLGAPLRVQVGCLPAGPSAHDSDRSLDAVLDRVAPDRPTEVFILPACFALNLWQRTMLGEALSAARRRHPSLEIHHDTVDVSHPLLVDCFASLVFRELDRRSLTPPQVGLLVAADGQGDPTTRAYVYRLMRLLWEQTGVSRAEVGFVRHVQPFLPGVLARCGAEPLEWIALPACQWEGETTAYAQVMLDDHRRANPGAEDWRLLDPPRDHPAILAWLEQRLVRLWQDKRARQAVRAPSARRDVPPASAEVWTADSWQPVESAAVHPAAGVLGRARDSASLAEILSRVLPRSERYLVKVTWHGYATGTFTGPAALDLLLGALPGRAVILEGHTSSRNLGGLDIDWEAEASEHRTWVRQQELEFLRRTGLAGVMARHGAQYLNVTEAWWDGACAPAEDIVAALDGETLLDPELAGFVPAALMEQRGLPMVSFARLKGPTRLGISNLFGLIPHPLRTAWHGAAITDFAAVCCDLATIYGKLFPTFGLVEGFESAVRWDRKGLYRSRWGNYDLVLTEGVFTLSEGFVGADILASRLQGQDVSRSAFFDVVRDRLGWSDEAAEIALPTDLQALLV